MDQLHTLFSIKLVLLAKGTLKSMLILFQDCVPIFYVPVNLLCAISFIC